MCKDPFFSGATEPQAGMETLPDGRHFTDANYLATTQEFRDHLEEIRETVEAYLEDEDEIAVAAAAPSGR